MEILVLFPNKWEYGKLGNISFWQVTANKSISCELRFGLESFKHNLGVLGSRRHKWLTIWSYIHSCDSTCMFLWRSSLKNLLWIWDKMTKRSQFKASDRAIPAPLVCIMGRLCLSIISELVSIPCGGQFYFLQKSHGECSALLFTFIQERICVLHKYRAFLTLKWWTWIFQMNLEWFPIAKIECLFPLCDQNK